MFESFSKAMIAERLWLCLAVFFVCAEFLILELAHIYAYLSAGRLF